MAQMMDLFAVQDMAIANAVPNEIPDLTTSYCVDAITDSFFEFHLTILLYQKN
jgi:hypothetical protein